MKNIVLILISAFFCLPAQAQTHDWRAMLMRSDGVAIPFEMKTMVKDGSTTWQVINGDEIITLEEMEKNGDSVVLQFPVYESEFRLRVFPEVITGIWIKAGIDTARQEMPVAMVRDMPRFNPTAKTSPDIGGNWAASFPFRDSTVGYAGVFRQDGHTVDGTFLTPYGDYRYLRGQVHGDSLYLSGFNGVQPTYFVAPVHDGNRIDEGRFYYANNPVQIWTARKQKEVEVDYEQSAGEVTPGAGAVKFRFRNTDGEWISLDDPRYRNKVIILQILGTWCPNCIDETAFLTEYYANKPDDVEIIALAYEYSTDWNRSTASLRKLENRFNVPYAILNTEVRVGDPQMTEKTLPAITRIGSFPTTIYLDKSHQVAYIETAFNGPATGEHHEIYKREFLEKIATLRSK